MDPFVLQALLKYTDGIQLTTVPVTLTSKNTAEFLLKDQYAVAQDNPTRIDALEEAAQKTFSTLLAGGLPDPAALGRDLGGLASDRRLLVWTKDQAEQALLSRIGLLGALPPAGGDGWSLTLNNASGNKIDTYLQRSATYTSTTDPATGETTGTLRVQLTNAAPTTGLPDYVIGNSVDLPVGTSQLYVSFYTPMLLVDATRDGQAFATTAGQEASWNVYSQYVRIPAGATMALEYHVRGHVDHSGELVTWTQPLATPLQPLG
jgi:hypothetical protein